jgi:hypothetical protein
MTEQQLGVGADVHHHRQAIRVRQIDREQAGRGIAPTCPLITGSP